MWCQEIRWKGGHGSQALHVCPATGAPVRATTAFEIWFLQHKGAAPELGLPVCFLLQNEEGVTSEVPLHQEQAALSSKTA